MGKTGLNSYIAMAIVISMKISRNIQRLYLALSAAVVLIVPSCIMDGEDGNLLVRVVMMLILSVILYLVYLLIRSLPPRR